MPLLVTLETIWWLESVYEVARQEILESMDELLFIPVLQFETPTVIRELIAAAQVTTLDLSDLLITYSVWRSGCRCVITSDKRAAKSEFFELLKWLT